MKVAAYQAPLDVTASIAESLHLIRAQVDGCESTGVEILCCPEGVLGGLADYASRPADIAIDVEAGGLDVLLAPLASDRVAIIVGFTEIGPRGLLYNSAAVHHRGSVVGIYRKLHPAINHSVYAPGEATPVFTIGELTFGVVICRDSTFPEPAKAMAAQGAAALFIPTNNGLPPAKGGPKLVAAARRDDVARATEAGMYVIRADVAGHAAEHVSYGSSGIVDPRGVVLGAARQLVPDLVVAEISTARREDSSSVATVGIPVAG